ncbi:MAG: hypothetical protein K9G83_02240 [Hyphomonadaceae bacterium]|jgi:hypothetical protein|nr:hypothetical protein [Hyphomonadaceae bacterium]
MTLIILDPTDERVPVARQISRRNGSISGTIGLLDISKPRGNVLLDELERLLLERLPEIKVNRYRKPTFAKPCPDDLRRTIKSECTFLVEALAD